MKKVLVLIDSVFPYGHGEPWLEDEQFFYDRFDEVLVFPVEASDSDEKRETKNRIVVVKGPVFGKVDLFICALKMALSNWFSEEWRFIKNRNRTIAFSLAIRCIKFLAKSLYDFKWIKKYLVDNGYANDCNITFYSYWMKSMAFTCLMLKKSFENSVFVTRCHGIDLYEYRHPYNYIPMRKAILNNVDAVFSISEDGKKYLFANSFVEDNRLRVSYLGARDYGLQSFDKDKSVKTISILTCSNIVEVKRLDRLINVLSEFKKNYDGTIIWTHYGDGPLKKFIENMAHSLLDQEIIKFTGGVSHEELMELIKNDSFDVFINTSDSEGIPVSIMEALSFGIPVIAPDIGGIHEIINANNGFLIDEKNDVMKYVVALKSIEEMDRKDYLLLRRNARTSWEEKWNLNKNYYLFTDELYNLTSSRLDQRSKH